MLTSVQHDLNHAELPVQKSFLAVGLFLHFMHREEYDAVIDILVVHLNDNFAQNAIVDEHAISRGYLLCDLNCLRNNLTQFTAVRLQVGRLDVVALLPDEAHQPFAVRRFGQRVALFGNLEWWLGRHRHDLVQTEGDVEGGLGTSAV